MARLITFGPAPIRMPRRRGAITRNRRDIPWSTIGLTAGCALVGLYVVYSGWSATRVHVDATGLRDRATLTSAALASRTVTFEVDPAKRIQRSTFRVDGRAVPPDDLDVGTTSMVWRPGVLTQGPHEVVIKVPRPALGASTFRWRFVVDDTPPRLEVPTLLNPASICQPMTIQGQIERGAQLTVDGKAVDHNGRFSLSYDRPPAAPLILVGTDAAGNRVETEVIAPVHYPGGQGVHATAAAWGFDPLRRGILALADAGVISAVQLDLKDEGGIVGFNTNVRLAHQIGAVVPEYNLKEAVADLKRRKVRVIGRIVAFRDPKLAQWAWNNNRRDWVIQDPNGGMLSTYGGFTNHTHAEVHRYNLDLALDAVDAGVDDILWDYVRRPEGDPATMVIPGRQGSSADAVVQFLTTTHGALRERCAYQGASVFGIAADRPDAVGQDVPRIARHVDYIAPMLYPSHWVAGEYRVRNPNQQPYDIVRAALADFQAKAQGTGRPLVPWLQDFSLGYAYGPNEVRAQIDAARDLGVTDWLLWNAGSRYTNGALHQSLVGLRPAPTGGG